MSYANWSRRVAYWAHERNLIHGSSPERQLVKLQEEMDELAEGIAKGDPGEISDAVGDCCVVLQIICTQLGLDFDSCLEAAWEEIKDRKGKMVDGIFVKETA